MTSAWATWPTLCWPGCATRAARSPVEHWYSLTASDAAPGTVDVTRDDSELSRAGNAPATPWDGSCGT